MSTNVVMTNSIYIFFLLLLLTYFIQHGPAVKQVVGRVPGVTCDDTGFPDTAGSGSGLQGWC